MRTQFADDTLIGQDALDAIIKSADTLAQSVINDINLAYSKDMADRGIETSSSPRTELKIISLVLAQKYAPDSKAINDALSSIKDAFADKYINYYLSEDDPMSINFESHDDFNKFRDRAYAAYPEHKNNADYLKILYKSYAKQANTELRSTIGNNYIESMVNSGFERISTARAIQKLAAKGGRRESSVNVFGFATRSVATRGKSMFATAENIVRPSLIVSVDSADKPQFAKIDFTSNGEVTVIKLDDNELIEELTGPDNQQSNSPRPR